jgi:hypothetical protein
VNERPFRSKLIVNDLVWTGANWTGISYIVNRMEMAPPILGLKFLNRDLGSLIFRKWMKKIGGEDRYDELRISVIEDLPGMNGGYIVIVGSSMAGEMLRARSEGFSVEPSFYIGSSSVCRLHSPNPGNLEAFKYAYAKYGKFYLVPLFPSDNGSGSGQCTPDLQLSILKKEINFRRAGEIPRDDVDGLVHNGSALSFSYYMLDLGRGGITFFSKELLPEYLH